MRGYFFYRRRMDRRGGLQLLAFLLCVLVLVGLFIAGTQMRPLLSNLATSKVSNTVTRIVTQAVNETIDSGAIQYETLVAFQKDNEGKITAVTSNMPAFNRLQSQILNLVLERISEVSTRDLSIPIGSLSGSSLLAGRGPRVQVRMQSIGSSSAYLENAFVSGGINQTKHQILLHVDVYVSILLPGFSTATKVANVYTVAETVIVGSVPNSYTYFSAGNEELQEDAREYILNKSS
ncbi:MAG: sporulation protein YunB [Oscillibacter sp.]